MDYKLNGFGERTFRNGDFYMGEFLRGKYHGKGSLHTRNGKGIFIGDF